MSAGYGYQSFFFQIRLMHIDPAQTAVFIGLIIINAVRVFIQLEYRVISQVPCPVITDPRIMATPSRI